jgi:hypothetical protein
MTNQSKKIEDIIRVFTTIDDDAYIPLAQKISGQYKTGKALGSTIKTALTGIPGQNAFALLTQDFIIPALNSSATATVSNTSFLDNSDQVVLGGFRFTVVLVLSSTTVNISNLTIGQSGTIFSGAKLKIGGEKGNPGIATNGINGISSIATITNTSPANIPAIGLTVSYTVDSTQGFIVGQFITVGANSSLSISTLTTNSLSLLNIDATPGQVNPGTKIFLSGRNGVNGINGISSVAIITGNPPNIPNYNATADYTFESTAGLLIGHYYGFENTSGVLLITAKNGNTITVKNISVTPTTVIATGIKLAPVGRTGASSFAITTNSSNTIVPNIGLNFSLNFEDTSPFPNQGAISIDGIVGVAIVIGKTGNLLTLQNDSIAPNTIIQPARTVFNAGRRGADANISSAGAFTLVEGAAPNTSANQMGIYVDPVDKRLKKREQSNGVSSLMIGVIYAPTISPPIGSSSYDWVATDIDEKHYWKPTGNAGAGIWVQYTG